MIKFGNGLEMDFASASGALAWYGEGWWWEKPLRWAGFIRPDELTIISKTLTFEPRKGNLKWWCPWRCVRLAKGGAVNAVGLTNPGYEWWVKNFPAKIRERKIIASIMPGSKEEAEKMVKAINPCPIFGMEINVSCPNVDHDASISHIKDIVDVVKANSKHPVILKLGYHDPYLDICKDLDGKVDAFDLINTISWDKLYTEPSPLKKYNLVGGVSGPPIREFSKEALVRVKASGVKTPVISGGGVDSIQEVFARFLGGAGAVTFGTLFLREPWKPAQIIKEFHEGWHV